MTTPTTSDVRTSPLSPEEIHEFSNRGMLRPGKVFDDGQIAKLVAAIELAREREREAGREYDLLDQSLWPKESELPPEPGKSVGFLFNLWLWNDDVRKATMSPVLAKWSSQLLGARQVRLLEDNALFKDPGIGGSLKWHQDYPYWPLAQPNAVTAWIALGIVDEANGAMKMVPGSHLTGETLPAAFGTGSTYMEDMRAPTVKAIGDPDQLGLEQVSIDLQPGEVSFHHSLTWHASGPNTTTDRPRRSIVIRYVADGTIWLGKRRYEFNYSDEEVGFSPGEPLQGKYFPIIPF
ncbi:MAG TPA: phytanoyl-CoA dioxygenase family protein [Acidimicrobiia bacterium]|nr:phytanoyl-CoA dioxygenase family protein [Acidimicrobiia bacterium]